MNLTDDQLFRILSQPGYTLAEGSLLPECPQAAQEGRGEPLSSKPTKGTRRGIHSAWRSEREFMAAVFEHIEVLAHRWPELSLAYHPANENSHRQPGVRGGVPDVVIPVPRGGAGALFIELKLFDGKLSQKQRDWIRAAEAACNYVAVVYGDLDEVIRIIEWYMGLEKG